MKGGPLTKPSKHRPVYVMDKLNNIIDFFHDAENITVEYIANPSTVNWNSYTILGAELYDSTNSKHFELHPSEETKLVIKILGLAGITLKDPALYQAAAAEDNKNIQQEKQ